MHELTSNQDQLQRGRTFDNPERLDLALLLLLLLASVRCRSLAMLPKVAD
jgi:hypothetical protein